MGANSKIAWTDHTFNAWIGCTETSPACDFCYARTEDARRKWTAEGWGAGKPRHRTSAATWQNPIKWNREAERLGIRYRVFSLSLGDWADQEVPEEWRDDLERLIDATPNLDWLLLTKRHTAALKWAKARPVKPNVRIGMTVENEEWAKIRLPHLAMIAMFGWKTFVSYEPALGPVNWDLYLDRDGIFGSTVQWIVAGQESGPNRRDFEEHWVRDTRDPCQRHGVPFLYKQKIDEQGRKIELPMLDGRQWAEFPAP